MSSRWNGRKSPAILRKSHIPSPIDATPLQTLIAAKHGPFWNNFRPLRSRRRNCVGDRESCAAIGIATYGRLVSLWVGREFP